MSGAWHFCMCECSLQGMNNIHSSANGLAKPTVGCVVVLYSWLACGTERPVVQRYAEGGVLLEDKARTDKSHEKPAVYILQLTPAAADSNKGGKPVAK